MSKIGRWFQKKHNEKLEKLKQNALRAIKAIRPGRIDPEVDKAACRAVLKALRAGVQFDPSDPIWRILRYTRMKEAMEQVCKQKTGLLHKTIKAVAWTALAVGGTLGVLAAIATAPEAMPVWAAAATKILAAAHFTGAGAGAIGAITSFVASGVGAISSFLLGKKERNKNKLLWLGFLDQIEHHGKDGGLTEILKSQNKSLTQIKAQPTSFKDLSAFLQRNARASTPKPAAKTVVTTTRRNSSERDAA